MRGRRDLEESIQVTGNQKKPPSSDEPRVLADSGLSLRDFQAFAAGAVRFYASDLRRQLLVEDLIEIQAPDVEPDLRFVLWVELEEQVAALLFFRNPLESTRAEDGTFQVESHWEIAFLLPEELEPATEELWSRGGALQTPNGRCPLALQHVDDEEWLPDPDGLGFMTGLLEALAATTEAELNHGEWEKPVSVAGEEVLYRLRLPDSGKGPPATVGPPDPRLRERPLRDLQRLMKDRDFASVDEMTGGLDGIDSPDRIPHPEPVTAEEHAQELIDSALRTRGRSRLKLARLALERWPDCAEAYVLQAELLQDLETRLGFYRQGVAAGERALGPLLDERAGELWDVLAARPYLRALQGEAETLLALNRVGDAVGVLREMLGLEARDPLQMRNALTTALLSLGRDVEARELLDRYGEELTWPAYSRALLAFRQGGDTSEARHLLHKAFTSNGAVPLYLLDLVMLPGGPTSELPEPIGEAAAYAMANFQAWDQTPGALHWVDDVMMERSLGPGAGPQPRSGKKKKEPPKGGDLPS
jgi:tetratricopeptide (TPR) repeat protein